MTAHDMSALDTAFLCLDQHDAPMHMGAVAIFAPAHEPDPDRLRELLAERATRIARMRRCVRPVGPVLGRVGWVDDPDFDADNHVHNHQLPWPGGPEELSALTSELVSEPLDRCRPLWELHVITGLHGGRFAVLVKLHHAMADGAGAVELGLRLLDGFGEQVDAEQQPPTSPGDRIGPALLGVARSVVGAARRPDRFVRTALESADDIGRVAQGLLSSARQGQQALDIGMSVARNLKLPAPSSPMLAPASSGKRVELFALDLNELRRVRKRHGGTTNDVVLAVVTGALRRWLTARGYPVETLRPRALVPVSYRARNEGSSSNNQLSGYLCDLPVDEPDPRVRLDSIRSSMKRNKCVGPQRGPGAIPVLADRLPPEFHNVATRAATRAAPLLFDTVVTNVPLPDMGVELDGAPLREMYPLVPLASGQALSVAASQYRDRVHIGLQANSAALGDIEKFNEAIPHALAELDDLDS